MQQKKGDPNKKAICFGELSPKINEVRGYLPFGTWVKIAVIEKLEREANKTD